MFKSVPSLGVDNLPGPLLFEKVAGAVPYAGWDTEDEIHSFLKSLSKADRKDSTFCLVNALGASEWYGHNINADAFPWTPLCHPGVDYGHKTFLNANVFANHVNKDPAKGFGKPVRSMLNHHMKRVELIIRVDRAKANQVGHGGIITRLDAGEFIPVSMGCRTPYDRCSICDHKAKTEEDYCVHMRPPVHLRDRFGPRRILPDGRSIFVYTDIPRFFDLSFVLIGADRTARVMAKLAQVKDQVCLGDVCAIPQGGQEKSASAEPCCDDCGELEKVASIFPRQKTAAQIKLSELIKYLPAMSDSAPLKKIIRAEPDLESEAMEALASISLDKALGATASRGIVLKPKEYGALTLRGLGKHDLADELMAGSFSLPPMSDESEVVDINFDCCGELDDCLSHALLALNDAVEERSVLGTPFLVRLSFYSHQSVPRGKGLTFPRPLNHPLLEKISSAYNGYRRNLVQKLAQAVESAESDPTLRARLTGSSPFQKTAGSSELVTSETMQYLLGAHLQDRGLQNDDAVIKMIASHPKWLE